MNEQGIKDLIKIWFERKARMETDPIFKFLCLWICFNAWLDYRSHKDTDKKMIEWLIGQSPETCDLVYQYEEVKKTKPFIDNLKGLAIETQGQPIKSRRGSWRSISIKDENDFENIVKAIYKIRCNLFHGEKNPSKNRDQKLIASSAKILEKWIGNLVASWKSKN